MSEELENRMAFSKTIALEAGALALKHFASIGDLVIEQKGVQDLVSNADREVEVFVRDAIANSYPNDGIVGEEYDNVIGDSGYTWVIDPIDGTANFVTGIPQWCVILACVHEDQTKLGTIFEPCTNELFSAMQGGGALLNDKPIQVSKAAGLNQGNLGVGMNNRTERHAIVRFVDELASRGGIFFRNSSGGLMLSYVAAGRLIGYAEPHMNAWDCLAGQLLIAEAGGKIETQSASAMLENGGRVVASSPAIFDELVGMADRTF